MISNKAIIAWIFSAIVGIGMLLMPARAMARDWDHDGDGWRHQHHDNGRHNGWYKHHGDEDEDEEEEHEGHGYYPPYYGYHHEPDADDYGYGYGYRRQILPRNGAGMVNPRNPGLVWTCDSDGHHCHWGRRAGYRYPQTGLNPFGWYYGNNGYGNGYYGNSGYGNGYYGNSAPLGGLGSLLGIMP